MSSFTVKPSGITEPWALRDLPPFPWITTKVLQLFAAPDDDIEVNRLTELIRADASLASELLRRANSALYGLRSQVSSVERAVAMLGLDKVKNLSITLGVGSYLKAALRLTVLRNCWRHSLGCALIAEELSLAYDIAPNQAYTAGLLHDVGRLGLLVKYPQSYADLLSVVMENHFGMLKSERDLFDLDHCEAGAWLAQEWDFPDELVLVIGEHHSQPKDDCPDLLRLLHLSCRLADSMGFEVVDPAEPEDAEHILEELPSISQSLIQLNPADLKDRITTQVNGLE